MNGTRNVLIVDDDRVHREILGALVNRLGHQAYLADSGPEALKLVEDVGFDLVLTDLIMPKMDGASFAMRARELRPDLQIVFLTGYPDAADAVVDFGFIAMIK